jgi:hypothetical protein
MQTRVGELLQGIIHKPVLSHTAQTVKYPSTDTYTEMRAVSAAVSACMTGVCGTFILDLQEKGL